MYLILTVFIVLGAAYIFTGLGKRMKIPAVVALLLCGLVLDIPVLKDHLLGNNIDFLFVLGDIALIFLMFLAGLESSWKSLYKERKDAVVIAVCASVVPFLVGFVTFLLLGFSMIISFIVGICMSITAEATKARVLLGLKKLRTKVGSAMMGAGIIDDVIGLSIFVLVTYILKEVYLKEDLLIAGAILAFFVGVYVQRNLGRDHYFLTKTEKILIWFIVPFFFISVGIHFDMGAIILNPSILTLVIVLAIVGKLAGSFLAKPFTDFSWKQLHLIGWAMNSRGAVEMALALIAFRSGLLPQEIYSSLIIMALVTTSIFPFIITSMIKDDPKIMD